MRIPIIICLASLLVIVPMPTQGKSGPEQILKTVTETLAIRQKTQKKDDAWEKTKQELIARYQSLKIERDRLLQEKAGAEGAVTAVRERVNEAERKVIESHTIRNELKSYLESVFGRLETFIKRDLPFLPKERAYRIASVRHTLNQPQVSGAEKYRRVMEALQVETEYGRTVDVYQDTIELDGQAVLVDILRLGRLCLFFETPDGKQAGHYERVEKKWMILPPRYRRDIHKAVEIARRERSVELVKLPIGRIVIK